MTRTQITSAALGGAALLLALSLGCQPNQPSATTDKAEPTATTDAPADKTGETTADPQKPGQDTADKATEGGPCKEYGDKVCAEAGEKSGTCGAFRQATSLMPPAACTAGLAEFDFTKKALKDMGKVCDELTAKLCKDLGPESQTCGMVKSVTASFPPDRCQMMMANYSEVLAELKAEEARNKPLTPEQTKTIATAADTTPATGAASAKVTIVEFSDFQCPYCSSAADAMNQVKEKYGDKVRIIFRQFPLPFHTEAHLAAQASIEAHKQGKFWKFHDLLFKNQKALKRPDLEKYAQEAGLNMAKFKKALDDKTYAKAVDADLEMGKQIGVSGTPSLFVNGARVMGRPDLATLSGMIDKQL